MTPAEGAIHKFVREHAEAETRFLAEIVKIPSDNPPGDCDRSAGVVATLLEGLGFQVERHKVPENLVKANGMISATNLIARRRFGQGGPTIALNAHGDVVPPGSGWTHDPYGAEIVDGWMMYAFLSELMVGTALIGTPNAMPSFLLAKSVTIDVGSGSRTKLIWLKHGFGPQ